METYRAAVIGCSRMGAFIDNEVPDYEAIKLPYSHAAGFYDEDRTELIACVDLRPEVMEQFGNQYNVPKEKQYTDYREMIQKEQPDIVSVATQPEHRAEIVIHAAEHGVKAIYAEKAMASSMDEAAAMVSAVEENNVAFNLGTNRRWHTGFDKMKQVIDSGEIGRLRTLIIYSNGTLFNTASHNIDLILRLNSDVPASWVSGYLPQGDSVFNGDVLKADPSGAGTIYFENGVTAHALLTPRSSEWEAICDGGTVTCWNNGWQWHLRKNQDVPGWRTCKVADTFPSFERTSSTANLIKDLIHSLDTGQPTRGGVRCAYASTELIFGIIESHLQNGKRIELPLKNSIIRLNRNPTARQPRFN
ncbi:MAG: Gfo/Idh/MocA family oxidoreductase [Candidatus Poribacteria bacterium]|nr:Gfo/Idh/MocA family oxidoreductase [Candidatus Poribacteria bacterium]